MRTISGMGRGFAALSAAVLGAGIGAGSTRADVEYNVTDLGSLGGQSSAAAINDSGHIVGGSYTPAHSPHAFRSDGVVMTDLGTLGGLTSGATGINASGEVVGTAATPVASRAFRISAGGVMIDMGTLGGSDSQAWGINAGGQVVGAARTSGKGFYHAFRTNAAGALIDLGTFGGPHSDAAAINDAGQITGSATDIDHHSRAFRTNAAGIITDLGTLGGESSFGHGINESGQVVGYSRTANNATDHAFRTDAAGVMTDLGVPGWHSYGLGINDAGDVVGHGSGPGGQHAFLYRDGRGLMNLNDLISPAAGWRLRLAADINNVGQIVGYGLNAQGLSRAFLLTPVPEPAGATVIAIGVAGLSRRRGRR